MPFVNYICPDGVEIKIEDCIEKCRMVGRCVSLPTLMLMAQRRPWKGVLSTTQALNGTRYEYLRITKDYAEKPVDRAFALLGTLHHLKHQNVDVPDALVEEKLSDELGTGIPDLLINGELWDYKTAAAYKVRRWLGKKREEEVIPPGEKGHGVYTKGKNKGEPRTRPFWSMTEPDIFDLQMQVSRYAMLWRSLGPTFKVDKAFVQVTVRDFSKTMTPRMHGLDRAIYVIPIPLLDEETVSHFYMTKATALMEALDGGVMPPPCSPHEAWDGKRCAAYCPVWMHCDEGQRWHDAPAPEEEE
jgi:hypothetical protein